MDTPENATDSAPRSLSGKLEAVRERRRIARRPRYRRSKLIRYRVELVTLHRMGASYRELSLYMWHEHRMRADPTTVRRYLVQLPEVTAPEADHA